MRTNVIQNITNIGNFFFVKNISFLSYRNPCSVLCPIFSCIFSLVICATKLWIYFFRIIIYSSISILKCYIQNSILKLTPQIYPQTTLVRSPAMCYQGCVYTILVYKGTGGISKLMKFLFFNTSDILNSIECRGETC